MKIYIVALLSLLLITILFVGMFRDNEFYEPSIFLKHKPTFKFFFYSPIGMSNSSKIEGKPDLQEEELAFMEFVDDAGVQYPGSKFWFIPFMLIQLTLSFFVFVLMRIKYSIKFNAWQLLLTHFIINILISTVGIKLMLFIDNLFVTIGVSIIILIINYLTIYYLTKKRSST